MTAERLQKVLARAGVGSRRGIEEMIRAGRITVNGHVAELGERADLEHDAVKVDGKRIVPPAKERRYLLLNKPQGYVSTLDDPEGRATVLELVPQRLRPGLVPVGRLDFNTEGLLLLTDDGDFAHHVAHPRFGCHKTYEVKVKGHPPAVALQKLRTGVVLDGRKTAPAKVVARDPHQGPRESVENSWWRVTLQEGRSRQIREMFQRVGHPVIRLRRVAIGSLADPHLPSGAWRELTPAEVEKLRQRTAKKKKPRTAEQLNKPPAAKKSSGKRTTGKKPSRPAGKAPGKGGPPRGRRSRG